MKETYTRLLGFVLLALPLVAQAQLKVPSYDDPTSAATRFPKNFTPNSRQLRTFQLNATMLADAAAVQAALPAGFNAVLRPADGGRGRVSVDVNVGRRVPRPDGSVVTSGLFAVFTLATNANQGNRQERVLLGTWVDDDDFATATNAILGAGSVRVLDSFDWEVSQRNGEIRFRVHVKERRVGLDLRLESAAPDVVGTLTTTDANPPLIFRYVNGHTVNKAQYLATRFYKITPSDVEVETQTPGLGTDAIGVPGGGIPIFGLVPAQPPENAALPELRVFTENASLLPLPE